MSPKHPKTRVVVDGSNLATEGRVLPSFSQLREAVDAFVLENPQVEVIIVADASFEHRVATSERAKFNEAVLAGDVVTPPAGAVGRGDAFILKIADRVDGVVLSNDSFQEFHDDYPWLFDEGRLVGGKPVRGVGWIFTPRLPVRNTKATRTTKKLTVTLPSGKKPEIGTTLTPVKAAKKLAKKATVEKDKDKDNEKDKVKRTTKAAKSKVRSPKVADAVPPAKKVAASAKVAKGAAKKSSEKPPAKRTKKLVEVEPLPATVALRRGRQPVNPQEVYAHFAATYKIGARVEGEVTAFTSHGAVIKVMLKGAKAMECYAPTASLASPAPARARDVLKRGDVRTFHLMSVDAERRIAELSLL